MLKILNQYLTTLLLRKRMEAFKAGYDAQAGDTLRRMAEFECPTLEQLDKRAFFRGCLAASEDLLKVLHILRGEETKEERP